MKLYFARHGESQANILHEISNRGLTHPLTKKGRAQVLALAHRLETRLVTHIYSSPVLRAIETSALIANHLGVEYEVTEALREYDMGIMEGRGDEEAWRRWQQLFDDWSKHQLWDHCVEGGETFHEVKNRFVPFIEDVILKYSSSDDNILCIAHGGLYWMMLPQVLKNIDMDFIDQRKGIQHTSLIVSEWTAGGLMCTEWNEVLVNEIEQGVGNGPN
jgi:broad specificity phosphatase PhoE